MKDFFPLSFSGLTPSGDTLTTTLGNTLRSVLYYRFCLFKAGISYSGPHAQAAIFASGDDVVIFCDPTVLAKLR